MARSPATREWLALMIDWLLLSLAFTALVAVAAAVVYALLPAGVSFVVMLCIDVPGTLAAIYWLAISTRTRPRGVGRRLLRLTDPMSALDLLRRRRPSSDATSA